MTSSGFDKKSYLFRGIILAVIFAAGAGYLEKWIRGTGGIWPALIAMLAGAVVVLLTEHKSHLLLKTLGVLTALAFMGLLRTLVTPEPTLPVLMIFGTFVFSLGALERHRRRVLRRLDQRSGDGNTGDVQPIAGDNTGTVELNLKDAMTENSGATNRGTRNDTVR